MTLLSESNRGLIKRFLAAYNGIDQYLRAKLDREQSVPFTAVLRDAGQKLGISRSDTDLLRIAADLRNILTHEMTLPDRYPAIPTEHVVEFLEGVRRRLTRPALGISEFRRTVTTKQKTDTLADVLRSIREHDYSQYPIYDQQTFVGLLTENGITRWLADHVSTELDLVDLSEISVGRVLRREGEKKLNCQFAGRNSLVSEIRLRFAEHSLLEAVLFTDKGRREEELLGIATRWDLLRVRDV